MSIGVYRNPYAAFYTPNIGIDRSSGTVFNPGDSAVQYNVSSNGMFVKNHGETAGELARRSAVDTFAAMVPGGGLLNCGLGLVDMGRALFGGGPGFREGFNKICKGLFECIPGIGNAYAGLSAIGEGAGAVKNTGQALYDASVYGPSIAGKLNAYDSMARGMGYSNMGIGMSTSFLPAPNQRQYYTSMWGY